MEQCSFADSALDEIADAYAAFLGGDAITDWETLPLQLHEPCAVRYSVSAQLYLCVARSGQGLRVSAASLSPQDAAAYRGDVAIKEVCPMKKTFNQTTPCAVRLAALLLVPAVCVAFSGCSAVPGSSGSSAAEPSPPLPPRNRQRNLICPACARCTRG